MADVCSKNGMEDKGQLVSVIVPAYNVETWLDRCVKSLVGQSYHHLEIILVDDGSVDSTPVLCDAWEELDARIRVIHKPNGGLSDARNAGLDVCSGEWIAFVDSDDYVDTDFILKLVDAVTRQRAMLAICSAIWEDENGEQTVRFPLLSDRLTAMSPQQCLALTYGNANAVAAWSKIYHKSIWSDLRFPKGRLHEDEFVFHKVLYRCDRIAVLPDRLVHYVQHRGSIMHTAYSLKNLDRQDAWLDRLQSFIDHCEGQELITPLVRMMLIDFSSSAQLDWKVSSNRQAVTERIGLLYDLAGRVRNDIGEDTWNTLERLYLNPEKTVRTMFWQRRIEGKLKAVLHRLLWISGVGR